jgi:hypothetical protein
MQWAEALDTPFLFLTALNPAAYGSLAVQLNSLRHCMGFGPS